MGFRRRWLLGGFPKNRPCRWRCVALRPPAYVSARKGTRKQRVGGLDPGWTPEASPGVHLGTSVGPSERTTPSISPWIPSEGRSVSPSGVSPEIVSRARRALTCSVRRVRHHELHRPLSRHAPPVQPPHDHRDPVLPAPVRGGAADAEFPTDRLPRLSVRPQPE